MKYLASNPFIISDSCYNSVSIIGHQPFKIPEQLESVQEIQTEVMKLTKNIWYNKALKLLWK